MLRRASLVLTLLLAACSGSPSAPLTLPDSGVPDAGAPLEFDAGFVYSEPSQLQGTLTVHTGNVVSDGGWTSVRVLLGDGTTLNSAVDAVGDVTFSDPSLNQPQTVTEVLVTGHGDVRVSTMLYANRPEIWLPTFSAAPQLVITPNWTDFGTLTGTVTGFDGGDSVVLTLLPYNPYRAFGIGDENGEIDFRTDAGQISADYSMSLVVIDAGSDYLFGVEYDPSYDPVRVGMVNDIVLDGGTVSAPELVLDHPLDQATQLTIQGAAPYNTTANAQVSYFAPSGWQLFGVEKTELSSSSVSIPAISLTSPFDDVSLQAEAWTAADDTTFPAGQAETQLAMDGGTATLTLLSPLTIWQPPFQSGGLPVYASPVGFTLVWGADGEAQATTFDVYSMYANPSFEWTVLAPPGGGRFTFFPLPSNAAPVSTFPTGYPLGRAQVLMNRWYASDLSGYADYAVADSATRKASSAETRSTWLEGYMMFQ